MPSHPQRHQKILEILPSLNPSHTHRLQKLHFYLNQLKYNRPTFSHPHFRLLHHRKDELFYFLSR